MADSDICIFVSNKVPSRGINASGGDISNYYKLESLAESSKVVVISSHRIVPSGHYPPNGKIVLKIPEFPRLFSFGGFVDRFVFVPFMVCRLAISMPVNQIILCRTHVVLVVLLKLLRIKNAKIIIITRAFEEMFFLRFCFPFPKQSILRIFESFLLSPIYFMGYRLADGVVTNSFFMRSQIAKYFLLNHGKISVEYPKIGLDLKTPRFGGIKKIGFINSGRHKGSELILQLAEIYGQFEFFVYGDFLAFRDNIMHRGYEPNRENIYNNIDLLLVPSAWPEPYGRVATEAIFCGVPCLVSNKGGLREATSAREFVVMDDSLCCWARKINSLVQADPVFVKMRIRGAQELLLMRGQS
jgi:glycosyltransferase involved in cell wall biosynthesis